jgi:quinone-modifying oxidoreductase subunit QmoC
MPRSNVDFGWRLHGKTVGLLTDSSMELLPPGQRATPALLSAYCADEYSLTSCLQCGACTVNCNIAESDGATFPRRQMTLLQLGEMDKLLADPSIWLCFNCQDCTTSCPAKVGPGQILAALRRLAVEQHSAPSWLSRAVNQWRGYLGVLLAGAVILFVAIAAGGSFSPVGGPGTVRYAGMLPDSVINLVFGVLACAVAVLAAINAARVWKTFSGERSAGIDAGRFARSFLAAVRQIGTHKQFAECREFPLSRAAHLAVFYGFVTLMALAGAAAMLLVSGAPYPLPVLHPFKIAGNLAAAALIAGCAYYCVQRWRAPKSRGASSWFDWAPLTQLLLVAATGLLAEAFRYANLGLVAYPVYFVHLIFVFALIAGVANSKFAHIFYRTIALTAEQYKSRARVPRVELQPGRITA